MSQPDGSEPEDWKERKDINTRAVVEVLERRMTKILEDKLKGHVSWTSLAGILVAFLGLMTVFVTAMLAPVKEANAATAQTADKRITKTDSKVEKLEEKITFLGEAAAEQRVMFRMWAEKKSRARAEEEVEKLSKEK